MVLAKLIESECGVCPDYEKTLGRSGGTEQGKTS